MASGKLTSVYTRLAHGAHFNGSHVALDRNARGEEYVLVEPDWIDRAGIEQALLAAREFDLSITLTGDGLRIEPHTNPTVVGVDQVKRTLEEHDETDPSGA